MRKKIITSLVAIVILVAATVAITVFSHNLENSGTKSYETMADAEKEAPFTLAYPDRLGGIPVTGFESNSSMIEAQYGTENYVRKTLGVSNNSDRDETYTDFTEQNVGGRSVTFEGLGGSVFLAVWHDNNFAYSVFISEGVTAEEMTEYIEATR